MNKILIDLYILEKENNLAVQGIKIFLNKNKDINVDIIGDVDNLLTIKDNKRVNILSIADYKDAIKDDFSKITDVSLRVAIYLLTKKSDEYKGFVTYSKKSDVAFAANNYMHKLVESPLFIATFANYESHRMTCIGDLGFNENPSKDDYLNFLTLMSSYMKKALKKDDIEFKLLTLDKSESNFLENVFKNKPGYKGLIEGREIYNADTDIVVGHSKEFLGIISGLDHGISIYDEYIKSSVKKNVGLRYFVYPMFKSVLTNFHMEIDQKLTSGGNILLGFNKNIIVIDKNTIKQGVKVSLDLANKLETL